MASFFSNLFGRSEPKNDITNAPKMYPPGNFSVIQTEMEGRVILGSANKGYKDYERKAEFPWCLHIGIQLDSAHLNGDGLPLQAETDIAEEQEDKLIAGIKALETAHYIGHLFNEGYLDLYIYLADAKQAHEYLQEQIKNTSMPRPFGYEIHKDDEWNYVANFLS